MHDDIELLHRLGGLRDAVVDEVVWCKADRSLRLSIVDVFSHADARHDNRGPSRGVVTFVGMDDLIVETALFRGILKISGIDVDSHADGLRVRVGLSQPGSDIHLRCREIKIRIAQG